MSVLPDDVRELLQAVLDALDLPRPAPTATDTDAHKQLMLSRSSDVCIQLASLLRAPLLNTPAGTAERLRAWIADSPVTYMPRQDGDAS